MRTICAARGDERKRERKSKNAEMGEWGNEKMFEGVRIRVDVVIIREEFLFCVCVNIC